MFFGTALWLKLLLSLAVSFGISYAMTPPVKYFAEKVGAIDLPGDARRVHIRPVPRMGGLAIFLGFVVSVLLLADVSVPVGGMLIGASIIVFIGAVDDIVGLRPWIKLFGQIAAALVAIRCGIVFGTISNLNPLAPNATITLEIIPIPLTIVWIVGCTNAVNLIDGLDGLAVGVSSISSLTMLVVSLFVSEPNVAFILAALTGAGLGFIPYNHSPAKIFMGDVGSQLLGYVLATVSIMGLFKFHMVITFIVPVMALAVPLADTLFAFVRRILHGQSPFAADRGHFHHRLIGMGLNQKQAVAVLYGISAVLGLAAVLLASTAALIRIICLTAAAIISVGVWFIVFRCLAGKNAGTEK